MASYGGKKDDDGDSTLMKADRTAVFQEGVSPNSLEAIAHNLQLGSSIRRQSPLGNAASY
jgi:hypothetical protein